MEILVRLYFVGLPPDNGGYRLELDEPATVGQAVAQLAEKLGGDVSPELLSSGTFLVNKKAAGPDTVLQNNDTLLVLKALEGG